MRKSLLILACAVLLGAPASAVTMDWVTVGGAGNAADPATGSLYGAVATPYRIGKTEVTNTQYAELLNAADPSGANALGLYNANMGSSSFGGIDFVAGNAAGSKYVVKGGFASKPVNSVSFYDSLRFANWLHNGQGAGSTETGAYTLLGGTATPSNGLTVTRNAGATIFLTSEDEWYKAAYYDAGTLSYNPYPFADGFNGAVCELPAGTTSHSANCNSAVGGNSAVGALTDGGAYSGSPSEYGTFDQGGNVWEWSEAIISGSNRGVRGGAFFIGLGPGLLAASFRSSTIPTSEGSFIGFRVARLPEPGMGLLLACGLVGLGLRRRRTSARVAAPESSAPGAPGRARSPKRPRWLRQHLVSASRHRLPATILQRTPPTRLMRTARIFAMALAAALLWPACAATAVPFVPDFSAGPVVFDFEDGLQGWQLSGNAERLQTQVLGGDWAIFGDGEMLVGNQLPVLRMREIDLSEVARISFEQLLLGSDEGAIFLSHGFCYSSSSGGVFIVCSIDKYSPPFPDPPTNPGTFQFTVHEAFRRTVSLSIGFSTPGGLPKPPNGSVGFIDNITLYPIPEPTTALLLACGLVGLGVRRRLH